MNLRSITFNIEIARLGKKYLVKCSEWSFDAKTGASMDQPMLFDTKEELQQWLAAIPHKLT